MSKFFRIAVLTLGLVTLIMVIRAGSVVQAQSPSPTVTEMVLQAVASLSVDSERVSRAQAELRERVTQLEQRVDELEKKLNAGAAKP